MKLKATILSAVFALAAVANAAIYIPSNVVLGDGSADALFQNTNGSLNSGGILAMGYFTDGYVFNTSDMGANISAFTVTTSAIIGSFSESLGGARAGYVEGPGFNDTDILVPSPLIGRALYVFCGNLATLSGSTEWAVKQIAVLSADFPVENSYLANPLGGAPPVFGSFGTFTGDASGFGTSVYQTLQTAPIPEPSAALLGALGAMGLLRRRRN